MATERGRYQSRQGKALRNGTCIRTASKPASAISEAVKFLKDAMRLGKLKQADPLVATRHLTSLLEADLSDRFLYQQWGEVSEEEIKGATARAVDVFMAAYGSSNQALALPCITTCSELKPFATLRKCNLPVSFSSMISLQNDLERQRHAAHRELTTEGTSMKRLSVIALFASASILPFAATAAEHDHGGHHTTQASAPAKSPLLEATIKKLDKEKGRVTLSHEAMNGMPPMTMIFTVKDKAALKGAKQGGKALFRAENVNGAMELVEFKPLAK